MIETASNLPNKWMAEKGTERNGERKTLLRDITDRKLWTAMVTHVLNDTEHR